VPFAACNFDFCLCVHKNGWLTLNKAFSDAKRQSVLWTFLACLRRLEQNYFTSQSESQKTLTDSYEFKTLAHNLDFGVSKSSKMLQFSLLCRLVSSCFCTMCPCFCFFSCLGTVTLFSLPDRLQVLTLFESLAYLIQCYDTHCSKQLCFWLSSFSVLSNKTFSRG